MSKIEFQAMPLDFRIWDIPGNRFIKLGDIYPDCHFSKETAENIILDVQNLSRAINEVYFYDTEDDYIISQDTGLKDKNGKSIFTGDIIKFGEPLVVNYLGGLTWYARPSDKTLIYGMAEGVEVVGNIWQNPELLEKQHES